MPHAHELGEFLLELLGVAAGRQPEVQRCIDQVLNETVSGGVTINDTLLHIAQDELPFGGVGASGYGRFGGRQGIDSFTETRWITVETQPGHFPI